MKRKPEAFLDSSTLLYAQEIPGSNSELLVEKLIAKRFRAYICQRVVDEVMAFNHRNYSRLAAAEARYLLLDICQVVPAEKYAHLLPSLVQEINPKDREMLAAARAMRLAHLVAYDRHFAGLSEYRTPREFVEHLGLRPRAPEY